MSTQPVTLDMSKAQPIQPQPVTLDMSTARPIIPPPGYTLDQSQQRSNTLPEGYTIEPQSTAPVTLDMSSAQPIQGATINDVGNRVIVPTQGESFLETMQRAAAQGQRTTPEQINKEIATMPEKAAETMGVAALPLAVPATLEAVANAIPKVLPGTIEGVKALGTWAKANPLQAYLLYQLAKEWLPGAKKAIGIVKGMPDGQ